MAYECVIAGRYKLGKKIGSGSFGEIHTGNSIQRHSIIAISIETGEEVAIKLVLFNHSFAYFKIGASEGQISSAHLRVQGHAASWRRR